MYNIERRQLAEKLRATGLNMSESWLNEEVTVTLTRNEIAQLVASVIISVDGDWSRTEEIPNLASAFGKLQEKIHPGKNIIPN